MKSSNSSGHISNDNPSNGSMLAPAEHRMETQALNDERSTTRNWVEPVGRWAVPALLFLASLWLWDRLVVWNEIPHYIVPKPGLVLATLLADWPVLSRALGVTLGITVMALAVAIAGGVGLAVLFALSRFVKLSLFPYAVVLQVTPIISIAPLIFIYVDNRFAGLLICAWIVAFFPILSNTTLGLNSVDRNLRDLFRIYGANTRQRLLLLMLPSALPYFLGGLRIAGGLALIGAIVAEYVAGTGGIGTGLAYTILEASYRLNIPRMFAALILIAGTGVFVFGSLALLSHLLLRKWHESAVRAES